MKYYLKLVNFEFNRVAKIFFALLAIVFMSQLIGIIVTARRYLNRLDVDMNERFMTAEQYIQMWGKVSIFDAINSLWFLAPIFLCVAAIAFYIFLIWYRDWFGKNTFAYRLFMLPTARLHVFLAKLTTILMITIGFVVFQLLILPVHLKILQWMMPSEFYQAMSMLDVMKMNIFNMLMPDSLTQFILYYGAGGGVVTLLFTAILLERSYRLRGILLGLIYCTLAVIILLAPLLIDEFLLHYYFYTQELFLLMIFLGLAMVSGSLWLSNFLLKNKVHV